MKRLAVLGHPVAHSRSPAMQNAALEEFGLADEWAYEAIDVAPEEFEQRVRAMPDEGFVGANVTIPHKEAALALADTASPEAQAIGAANTLSFTDGAIHADNTDAGGLLDALGESPNGKRALVLGAGGAARAVVWALSNEGANVEVWNRTPSRAEKLCAELGGTPVAQPEHAAAYELIVNSTSVGLRGEDQFAELPLDAAELSPRQTIVDMVYGGGSALRCSLSPPCRAKEQRSTLLTIAGLVEARFVSGTELLIHQGARSLKIWTGLEPPIDVMRKAAERGSSR